MNYFFGFSYWKHDLIKSYFPYLDEKNIIFVNPFFKKNYFDLAIKKGLNAQSIIYIWGKKPFPEVEQYAKATKIPLHRVEDGFIRSVSLGSDLTKAYSLVVDSRGIYFDPTQESDLEHLLNFHDFTEEEVMRAKRLRHDLVKKKLSKYNHYTDIDLHLPDKKIVLVPGQVEDDASIRLGAEGMTNLELLKATRKNVPDAYIIFKPHPDILAGNRVGNIVEAEALKYCDRIVTEVSLDSVLRVSDEVHTMTSLVGFEALMRGIKVHTYGMPFYAGWGLSEDDIVCDRRQRLLSIDELTAATLLLYPHYIDPLTKELCEVEATLEGLEHEKRRLTNSVIYRTVMKIRNFISRKAQKLVRFFE